MSSSKPAATRQVPAPPGSRASSPYARFIPREELQGFASWTPELFGGAQVPSPHPAGPPPQPEDTAVEPSIEEWLGQVNQARQEGYRDGYRDGLVALESFKQSFAMQLTSQVGRVMQNFDAELGALEQQIAGSVARIATQLARQIVRSELQSRPELVVQVAQDAVNAVLMSARTIAIQVHPEDHALIAEGGAEAIEARGARLVSQPAIERGGCLIESDAGTIDARIESRWTQAVQALGTGVAWKDAAPAATDKAPDQP